MNTRQRYVTANPTDLGSCTHTVDSNQPMNRKGTGCPMTATRGLGSAWFKDLVMYGCCRRY